jgi:hypothetical protein
LKQAKFTQVVNDVKVLSAANRSARRAAVNVLFKMPDVLHTGRASRAELVAPDTTVTRVGANTIFSFDTANRTIDLQQGSLLFHSPHGLGGGTIRTSSVIAAVLGTTLIVSVAPDGTVKVLDLEGQVEVRLKNGHREILESGQMILVQPDGRHSSTAVFDLSGEARSSSLVTGFSQPLPSLPLINEQIAIQLRTIPGLAAVSKTVSAVNGTLSSAKVVLNTVNGVLAPVIGVLSPLTGGGSPSSNPGSSPLGNLPLALNPTLPPSGGNTPSTPVSLPVVALPSVSLPTVSPLPSLPQINNLPTGLLH